VTGGVPVSFERVEYRPPGAPPVLRDMSLEIAAGECVALVGRSGSGKTTALRLVNALLRPSAGVVRVDGRPTVEGDPIRLRRRTGYVIQDVGLLPHRTVAANAGLVCLLEGWDERRRAARVRDLLALVGLPESEFGGRYPHELSGGQRQRVGIARALATEPPLLLLDEPFGALDPITRRELQDEFVRIRRTFGTTAVFVTHDVREAARVADRVALLAGGRLVVAGTLEDLWRSDHPDARAFARAGGLEPTLQTGSDPRCNSDNPG
jgi:osmoprotectant transport system ATP-binding protein